MKNKIITLIFVIGLLVWTTGCKLDVAPTDAINTSSLLNTSDGLLNVTNGSYALLKDNIEFGGYIDQNNNYLRQYFQMSDFASDDITCAQVTEDPLFYSFTLTHSPDQANSRFFWYISYKIINSANTVIELTDKISSGDAATKQLIGENYFLRAFCHFNLLKFYAKPYSIDPDAPGIIIRTSTTEDAIKARSSVRECYNVVISDLEKAATFMDKSRGPQYASKEAAWALLSRVYLYMGDNAKTIEYANKVIESGNFQLETAEGFKTYFPNAASSTETIFLVAFTTADNKGKFGSISSMLYSDGNSGWGEEFASQSIRDEMSPHPEDVRWAYIDTLSDGSGGIVKKNGIETFYITKFSYQDGDPNLSSPVMLRLAEMYLNRAEALAKSGDDAGALADVDLIRSNRGLENALYNGVLPGGATALDVVLKERRIELAFEGHRAFDVYRNKRSMDRSYWGYHLPGLVATDIDLTKKPVGYANEIVDWTNPRIIYYIPVDEVLANPLCTQNP
jgi:starch-binding outer membrane protein, SusD/RagB family